MEKVNLAEKFSKVSEYFSPKLVGTINDLEVKVVKAKGEFLWHHHDHEDEMFLIVKGRMRMKVREDGREREIVLEPGEFLVMPHGTEHCPVADGEVHLMLFEPKGTLNTGNVQNERTVARVETI